MNKVQAWMLPENQTARMINNARRRMKRALDDIDGLPPAATDDKMTPEARYYFYLGLVIGAESVIQIQESYEKRL